MQLLRAVPPHLSGRRGPRQCAILAAEPSTLGHLALRVKHLLFDGARTAFVVFAVHEASWVALDDPIGS
jgi:lysylphosphatidylglycerol synthetase-like protein (DUF2156 family)